MSDMFYRSFEDRHRGSVELIKSRLEVYLPFIQSLKKIYKHPKGIDLGCGRGEWLELLQENNFNPIGIDLNEGMLERCRQRHLTVIKEDVLHYLKNLESESHEIISAFHLVEHIEFDTLRLLISEAHRVLKPGGLLIFETPNSENLLVGTSSFYLDPTHQKPIPELLLSFLAEHTGFKRTKPLFLQEPKDPIDKMGIQTILTHVSPDYAIVSQKNATSKILTLFDTAFNQDYGIRLLGLTEKYDNQIKNSFNTITNKCESLQSSMKELQTLTNKNEVEIESINESTQKIFYDFKHNINSSLETLEKSFSSLKSDWHQYEEKNNSALSVFFIEQRKMLSYITDIVNEQNNKIEKKFRKNICFCRDKKCLSA